MTITQTGHKGRQMTEVKIFFDDEDMYHEMAMDEYIMRYLLHHHVHGATLFRGAMGFGSHHHLHTPGRIGGTDAVPVMILFIDEDDVVQRILPHLKEVVSEGLITLQNVHRA
jgi:PII-like signaling protein